VVYKENIMNDPIVDMEDYGKRLDHLMQLQNTWSTVYARLTAPNIFHTDLEKARALSLEIALDLLQYYMEMGYTDVTYARDINALPKNPKEIPDDKKHISEPFTTHRDTV
jgi:hypothetical protein